MIPHGTQIPISHQFDARRLSGVEADMEMHEIKYFLAACRTLNFHRAAELSHVSQPALTRAIQKLEAELGGHLFHRERSQIRVTISAASCVRIWSRCCNRQTRPRWPRGAFSNSKRHRSP